MSSQVPPAETSRSAIDPLIIAARATPVGILSAKAAQCHHAVLREVCRNRGTRSLQAHLVHVAVCLAYTDDPTCVRLVIDECGRDPDAIAVAFMAADRRGSVRGVLPKLLGKNPLAASDLRKVMGQRLRPDWDVFLQPRQRFH